MEMNEPYNRIEINRTSKGLISWSVKAGGNQTPSEIDETIKELIKKAELRRQQIEV